MWLAILWQSQQSMQCTNHLMLPGVLIRHAVRQICPVSESKTRSEGGIQTPFVGRGDEHFVRQRAFLT